MRCGLVVALCFALSFSSWAESSPSPPSTSTPPDLLPSLNALDSLLLELSKEAEGLSLDSEELKKSLEQAKGELLRLSSELLASRTEASELSHSLRLSEESLATSARSLNLSLRRNEAELWVWRGATILGVAGMVAIAIFR